jgi:hypothetical protein
MNQYPHVRAQFTCVCCGGGKDRELLLCWPCHHKQKRQNEGGYSHRIESLLASLETRLRRQTNNALPAVSRASHYS